MDETGQNVRLLISCVFWIQLRCNLFHNMEILFQLAVQSYDTFNQLLQVGVYSGTSVHHGFALDKGSGQGVITRSFLLLHLHACICHFVNLLQGKLSHLILAKLSWLAKIGWWLSPRL